MTLAIRTRDLRKDYGDVQALDGLDLDVEQGEFFGLLGPNGAGKTTFINVLVGLVRKSGGEATVFGHDVETDYRASRNRIGLAPQEFNVDRFFSIREVLINKAGYHDIPRGVAGERADEVLQTVGIYEKRDTRFHWLSGGMKRRFMLARALVTDPDLLILDEPTAGVDVQLRHDLWEIIGELNEEGMTVLLTTHYIEEAERLADRVAIMDRGRKVTVATPEELMSRGADTVAIRLAEPLSRPPEIEVEGVEAVELDGNELLVTAHRGGRVAPAVLRDLDRQGIEVISLEITRTSLEEVFIELTEGRGERTDGISRHDEPEAIDAAVGRADGRSGRRSDR